MIDVVARLEIMQPSMTVQPRSHAPAGFNVLLVVTHASSGPGTRTMVRVLVEEQKKARQAAERAAEYALLGCVSFLHSFSQRCGKGGGGG